MTRRSSGVCLHGSCQRGPFRNLRSHHNNVHRGDHDPECDVCRENRRAAERLRLPAYGAKP